MSNATGENRVKKTLKQIQGGEKLGKTIKEKIKGLLECYFNLLKPPPRLDLDEWMDEYFYLPSESASEHGRWRTSRFPFLKKIMKKLSPSSPAREIGVSKGAQLGFTTIGVGWNIYIADQCPAPTLYVQPTDDSIKEYVEQKLDPSIAVCPKVKNILGENRPKYLTNTKKRKYFPGGYLAMASANSATSMRSKSIKNLTVDEEDGCNQNVGNEGSSIHLAIRRTSNFADRKIYRVSTPILKETSSIEPFCQGGTAERFLVPCPHCNADADPDETYFEIKWDYIKYENNNPKTAMLCCPECGQLIAEHNKTWMMDKAFWYRYNPSPKPGLENDERRNKLLVDIEKFGYSQLSKEDRWYLNETSVDDFLEEKPTFFISSLYSPLGFYSWSDAVSMWVESNSKRDKNILKTFYNTVLGLTFSETNDEMDFKGLKSRCEIYSPDGSFDIPMDALFITCGVDVQKDRLEAQVIATGENDEEWVIDYKVFYGDTAILGNSNLMFGGSKTCWGNLMEFLNSNYVHASGQKLPIECTLIDSRYRSQYVFTFCKALEHKNVFAVQGVDGWGKGYIKRPQTKNKYGVWVFDSMSDEIKVKIYSQLRNEIPGPNYIHFSKTISYTTLYFKGLTIEQLKTKRQGGNDVLYWENPPGGRNEPLDTYCYAKSALLAIRPNVSARRKLLFKEGIEITREKPKSKVISKGVQI